jgi:hypothetical protein
MAKKRITEENAVFSCHEVTCGPKAGARLAISAWERSGPRGQGIKVNEIAHFDARGMRPVYGRADHLGGGAFHMDVWLGRSGRLLARFWSLHLKLMGGHMR